MKNKIFGIVLVSLVSILACVSAMKIEVEPLSGSTWMVASGTQVDKRVDSDYLKDLFDVIFFSGGSLDLVERSYSELSRILEENELLLTLEDGEVFLCGNLLPLGYGIEHGLVMRGNILVPQEFWERFDERVKGFTALIKWVDPQSYFAEIRQAAAEERAKKIELLFDPHSVAMNSEELALLQRLAREEEIRRRGVIVKWVDPEELIRKFASLSVADK